MNQKLRAELYYSIVTARLTNHDMMLLRLWMEGYSHKEISFLSGLNVSQPAISKRITNIHKRVKRAYDGLSKIGVLSS